ncbi:MAG: tetraacyldisaccharide 4'-kinase [Elusimicrobia bacterium]|nr:tetraacyldisaccharide 4'-kinase [Elusimicrobiota bacterium]
MSAAARRERLRQAWWGRAALVLLSWVYGAVVWLRNGAYSLGLLRGRRVARRTVCIGNLTVGGTGKTPAVLLAAQTLRKRGLKPAILSRGYGRSRRGRDVQVLLDQREVPWQETGDEPWMMHRALKGLGVPILVSPDRVAAANTAMEYYEPDVLVLDDGFSHRRLARDADVVLLSALDPFGGGRLLPAGDLREPFSALGRAALAVITHSDLAPAGRLEELRAAIAAVSPELPVAEAVHKAEGLYDLKGDGRHGLRWLKDRRVVCLSGIGSPASFESEVRRAGADIVQTWRYPDHHPYTALELSSIESVRGGLPLITTFKDLPRLPEGWQRLLVGEVYALGVRLDIVKGRARWDAVVCGTAEKDGPEPEAEAEPE